MLHIITYILEPFLHIHLPFDKKNIIITSYVCANFIIFFLTTYKKLNFYGKVIGYFWQDAAPNY